MALATIGYFAIGNVSDPYDMPVMMTATFILGVGEISAIIAGNSLLGQEAPQNIRGQGKHAVAPERRGSAAQRLPSPNSTSSRGNAANRSSCLPDGPPPPAGPSSVY